MGRANVTQVLMAHLVQCFNQFVGEDSGHNHSYSACRLGYVLGRNSTGWIHCFAQEEERRTEAESALQFANVEVESLQAELEAAARAQSEQQSKLSLYLEYAQRVCGRLMCLPASHHHHYLLLYCL